MEVASVVAIEGAVCGVVPVVVAGMLEGSCGGRPKKSKCEGKTEKRKMRVSEQECVQMKRECVSANKDKRKHTEIKK